MNFYNLLKNTAKYMNLWLWQIRKGDDPSQPSRLRMPVLYSSQVKILRIGFSPFLVSILVYTKMWVINSKASKTRLKQKTRVCSGKFTIGLEQLLRNNLSWIILEEEVNLHGSLHVHVLLQVNNLTIQIINN